MEQLDFNKIAKALTIAYPYYFKDMSKEDALMFNQLYFSKLKKYDYQVVAKAIDDIIISNNYMPTLAEVIKSCDKEYRRSELLINTFKVKPDRYVQCR